MKYRITILTATLFGLGLSFTAHAQSDQFHTGPLIESFGPVATIEDHDPLPDGAVFKVSFDLSDRAEPGALNRQLESAARFLNMHAEAGVPVESMKLALVIHGTAVQDVTNAAYYEENNEQPNANAALIAELIKQNVEIHVCGQSAVHRGVTANDLLPGVRMSLSAMTAHALLQQAGYTLNPF